MKSVLQYFKKEGVCYKLGLFFVLLIPVVVSSFLFHPPAFGKSIIFRTVFAILLFFFCYDIFFKKESLFLGSFSRKLKAKKHWSFFMPLALVLFLFLSTIFSIDVRFSFFGDPSRGGGFLNFLMLILYGYLLFFIFNKKDWKVAWNTVFLTAFVCVVLAIIQWQGFFSDFIREVSRRPFSFFGNVTILAAYLSVIFFPVLLFFIREKNKAVKAVYLLLSFFVLFGVFITYTRAAYLAILIGFIYFILFYPSNKRVVRAVKLGSVLLVLLGVFFVWYINSSDEIVIDRESSFSEIVERLNIDRALNDPRLDGFAIIFEAVKQKPFLGYGPENVSYAFDQNFYYGAERIVTDVVWWDKAHNIFLEFGVWGGFLAMITLILVFVSLFYALHKKRHKNRLEKHAMKATLIAFVVVNFFTIDDFGIYLILVVIIGYIFHLTVKEKNINVQKEFCWREKIAKHKWMVLLLALFSLFFIYFANIKPLFINRDINVAKYMTKANNCNKAVSLTERTLKKDTVISSYVHFESGILIAECVEDERKENQMVFSAMKSVVNKRPTHVTGWINLGISSLALVKHESDKEYFLNTALESFKEAYKISPNRTMTREYLGDVFLKKGDINGALKIAKECLVDNYSQKCYFIKAASMKLMGDNEGANDILSKLIEDGYAVDEYLKNIISFHGSFDNYKEMIPYYLMLIENYPENHDSYVYLAYAYYVTEDELLARKYLDKALNKGVEENSLVEKLLREI